MENFFVEVKGIDFAWKPHLPLFLNFWWHLKKGESWAIIGPSGCGKTTLLYLLSGLIRPQGGEVRIGGVKLERPRPDSALILQDFGLLPWRTVMENIALGLEVRSFYGPDGLHAPKRPLPEAPDALVDYWLKRLGLEAVADHYPSQISGGQRQRTAIGRALVLGPDLLLMDEPFSSLDAPTRESLEELTLKLQAERGLTVITVTHSIEEAAFLGRKILCLGHPPHREPVVVEGPPPKRDHPDFYRVCSKLRSILEEGKR